MKTKKKSVKNFNKSILLKGEKNSAVLLVHGWSSSPSQLNSLATYLNKKGYWVYCPVLSGHEGDCTALNFYGLEDWESDVKKAYDYLKEDLKIENIFTGGISLGGNLALILSTLKDVQGVFLLGTPIHLRNHFIVWLGTWILPIFKKNVSKKYPNGVITKKNHSYKEYPIKSIKESLRVMKKTALSLRKVVVPVLVLQNSRDYLVAKYSPWIIYNMISSKTKYLYWIKTGTESHVPLSNEEKDSFSVILNFLKKIQKFYSK